MTEQEWLDSDSHKIILVDIAYYDGTSLNTKYFSDYPYTMKFGDTFDNILGDTVGSIAYEDVVFNISQIITKINSSKSLGNLTLLNTQGEYDELLEIANSWEGHPIKIYLGDPDWIRDQFILILEGVTDALTAPEQHLLSIELTDKKEVLNLSTQEDTLWYTSGTINYLNDATSSTGLYDKFPTIFFKRLYDTDGNYLSFAAASGTIPSGTENNLVPICLGKVFNIEPVLVDSYNHVYQIHECPDNTNYGISEVTEVRSNGVKLTGINDSYVDTLISGTGGTVDLTGVIVTSVSNDTITVTGADFTTNGYSRAVIHNTTLDEARYVISSASATVVDVDTNAANQTAQVAGWTTAHSYDVWYPTNAPTIYILQYEENLTAGCIRLLVHSQSTQITCDIIGQITRTQYSDNSVVPGIIAHSAAFLIEYLVLEKTSLVENAITNDICANTFNPSGSSPFTNTNNLGVYLKDSTSVLDIVTEIISSVGGYIRFERLCVLQIFRFVDPLAETSILTFTEDSIVERGFSLISIELPEKLINLGYQKNWTVQDKAAVAASVLDSDNLDFLDQLTNEYSNIIETTGVTNTEYPLITDPEVQGTLIYSEADANTEATRRSVLRGQKRYIYKLDAVTSPFSLNIGDVITIQHSRYGFDYPGKQVVIVGLEEYPTDKRVILEVWI